MSFQPNIGDKVQIGDALYYIAEHPAAPGIPYGQEGRQATVYQLVAGDERRALKVFKPRYSVPSLVTLADRLAAFADLSGLQVCSRKVLTARRHTELLRQHPDLTYAVLMPWIEGPTWMEVMLDKREFTPEQSLSLAHAFAELLAAMEERGVAHCDLSGPNVLLPSLATPDDGSPQSKIQNPKSKIELVDVEQLYGPGLDRPELLPGGSPGYAHHTAPQGLWESKADRFAGALLLAEMLGWCDERVRNAAWGESYFDPAEMQQDGERYRTLLAVLKRRWGEGVAGLFERVWTSDTLADCPTFGQWLVVLPEQVPDELLAEPDNVAILATTELAPITVPAAIALAGAGPQRRNEDVAGLFEAGLAAYRQGDWAQAKELLGEVVRRQPDYRQGKQQATRLLADADRRLVRVSNPPRRRGWAWVTVPTLLFVVLIAFGAIAIAMLQEEDTSRRRAAAGATAVAETAIAATAAQQTATAEVIAEQEANATQTAETEALAAASATALAQTWAQATNTAQAIGATQTTQTAFAEAEQIRAQTATAEVVAVEAQAQTAVAQSTAQAMQVSATLTAVAITVQPPPPPSATPVRVPTPVVNTQATAQARANATATAQAIAQAQSEQATAQAVQTAIAHEQAASMEATAQALSVASTVAARQTALALATPQAQANMATAVAATASAKQTAQAPNFPPSEPGTVWEHLTFNLDNPKLGDKSVRQAIAYALGRQQIADQVYSGQATVLHTFLPPITWASMQNPGFARDWESRFPLKRYNYDPGRANQLLDQSGWVIGSDGIRTRGGLRLSFDYVTTTNNNIREQVSQRIVAYLAVIGIEVRPRYLPAVELFGLDGPLFRRQFELAGFAWVASNEGIYEFPALYHSQDIPGPNNNYEGSNVAGYRNGRYDQLARAIVSELGRSDVAPMFAEMQSIWSEDLPELPLYVRP